jgi:hypothetical protein
MARRALWMNAYMSKRVGLIGFLSWMVVLAGAVARGAGDG